jgi:hypothetical protein
VVVAGEKWISCWRKKTEVWHFGVHNISIKSAMRLTHRVPAAIRLGTARRIRNLRYGSFTPVLS